MLPAELTSFVGRRKELAAIRRLIAGTRLLTLTGPGGVGKTRLAMRAAEQMRRAYPDGVHFVALDSLSHGDLLAATIAAALRLPDTTADATAHLMEFLRAKQLLLVLDNCEHVIDSSARLVARLLAEAPEVRVLVTSRQVLEVEGEQTLLVPPLDVPEVSSRREAAKLDVLALFADRAADSVRGFTLDERNWNLALRICAKLDGMPLAIELAVAWLRTLAIEELATELDRGLNLLDHGSHQAPRRQRTLRATIQWSYELADTAEQLLWARLSVFSGGATLEAIEAVCGGEGLNPDEVLGLLASLVDKSIVQRDDQHEVPRFRMLEAVRQFGATRLAAADTGETLRAWHRDYFLAMARGAEADWFGGRDQAGVYRRLRGEHANLRAALEFSLSNPGAAELGLELVTRLHVYWINCGLYGEGRRWLSEALSSAQPTARFYAKALWVCAYANNALGDTATSKELGRQALTWSYRTGDRAAHGCARAVLGGAALLDGEPEQGVRLCESARSYLDGPGETTWWLIAESILLISMAFGGAAQATLNRAKHAQTVGEATGQESALVHVRYALALALHKAGRHDAAVRQCQAGIRRARDFNDVLSVCMFAELLAWIAEAAGRFRQAAQLLGVVEQVWPLLGGKAMLGSPMWVRPHDDCLHRTRTALGAEAFQTGYAKGMANSGDLRQAVAFLLEERRRGTGVPRAENQLTKREQQVAELVAQGLTNREIAARLVVAPRTAETHVDHVLAKLGFTSRTQIASWIAGQPADERA
ncbi:ATP-binding protein [Crossiella cryophila]|nr:LuxR C-terminal-related transcriptional regulator [Crossiella cryophila]